VGRGFGSRAPLGIAPDSEWTYGELSRGTRITVPPVAFDRPPEANHLDRDDRAARQLRASDTPDGADPSGLERNVLGFVVRKPLNRALVRALCKLVLARRSLDLFQSRVPAYHRP
jgi:hypothetical protein